MWIAIAVIASLRLLHAGSTGVGLLMLAAGLGSLVAVPVSASLIDRPRIGTPAAVALILCGFPLGLVAGIPLLEPALVLVAAWGIGMAVADVATLSVLHRLLSAPLLPRVTASIESSKLALEGIGAFLAPFPASTIGVRGALVVAAVPLPVVVVAGWRTLHQVRWRPLGGARRPSRGAVSRASRHGRPRRPGRAGVVPVGAGRHRRGHPGGGG